MGTFRYSLNRQAARQVLGSLRRLDLSDSSDHVLKELFILCTIDVL
jgi:hypothetical protein